MSEEHDIHDTCDIHNVQNVYYDLSRDVKTVVNMYATQRFELIDKKMGGVVLQCELFPGTNRSRKSASFGYKESISVFLVHNNAKIGELDIKLDHNDVLCDATFFYKSIKITVYVRYKPQNDEYKFASGGSINILVQGQ